MADISSPEAMGKSLYTLGGAALAAAAMFSVLNIDVITTRHEESAETALRDLASRTEDKNHCDMRSFSGQQISWTTHDLTGLYKESGTATTKKIVGANIARDESSNVHISYDIQAIDDQPDNSPLAEKGSHATYSTTYTLAPSCADAKINKAILNNFMPTAG